MLRVWTPLLCIGTSSRVPRFSAGYSYDLEKPLDQMEMVTFPTVV